MSKNSDGTEAGTYIVKDINPGFSGSTPEYITVMNGVLYFIADDRRDDSVFPPDDYHIELWRSDGTASGTRMVKIDIQQVWKELNGLEKQRQETTSKLAEYMRVLKIE